MTRVIVSWWYQFAPRICRKLSVSMPESSGINQQPIGAPGEVRGVYLLCFSSKYYRAKHYIGYSNNFLQRWEEHKNGKGSPLVAAALFSGKAIAIGNFWPGYDRSFERHLKRQKNAKRFCLLCEAIEEKNVKSK